MKGIPYSVELEVVCAATESGQTLISRSFLENIIESNPGKFQNINKQSPLQRRKWISTAMNRKFPRTIGNAWFVEVQHGTV